MAEIRDVKTVAGPDTLFQIEVPVELVMLTKAPAVARPAMASCWPVDDDLAAGTAAGTRFAVHLCLGDMNNRAFGTMTDVSPLVAGQRHPGRLARERPLELMHAPFAAGDQPAPPTRSSTLLLRDCAPPDGVRFAAGFAHEAQSIPTSAHSRDRRRPAPPRGPGRCRMRAGTALEPGRQSGTRTHSRALHCLIRSAGPEP